MRTNEEIDEQINQIERKAVRDAARASIRKAVEVVGLSGAVGELADIAFEQAQEYYAEYRKTGSFECLSQYESLSANHAELNLYGMDSDDNDHDVFTEQARDEIVILYNQRHAKENG